MKERIEKDLMQYIGEYESFIDSTPLIYEKLSSLLHSDDISKEEREMIKGALAFFAAPLPIMVAKIYGPYSYVPMIFVGATALQHCNIVEIEGYVLQNCINLCKQVLDYKEQTSILEYLD